MSKNYLQLLRDSNESDFLQENHPNAFLLLCLIAKRARRTQGHPDGLEIGEAYIGDYEKSGIATRQAYRTALDILKMRGHIKISETCRTRKKSTTGTTTVGTLVKLTSSSVWNINPESINHQINHRATTEQPPSNHEQERTRKKKNEEETNTRTSEQSCDPLLLPLPLSSSDSSFSFSQDCWSKFLENVKESISPTVFTNWFSLIEVMPSDDGVLNLQIPNQAVKDYLLDNHKKEMLKTLAIDDKGELSINFTIVALKPKKQPSCQGIKPDPISDLKPISIFQENPKIHPIPIYDPTTPQFHENKMLIERLIKVREIEKITSPTIERWLMSFSYEDVFDSIHLMMEKDHKKPENPGGWVEIALQKGWSKENRRKKENLKFANNLINDHRVNHLKIKSRYCLDERTQKEFYFHMDTDVFQNQLRKCL